jgi:twitching motility protein PilT
MVRIEELLEITCQRQASDLHLVVGSPPSLRVDGELVPANDTYAPLTPEDMKALSFSLVNDQQKELLLANKEIDFSYQYNNEGRFRVNLYYQKGSLAGALRLIPTTIRTIEDLRLPAIYNEFAQLKQGLVLVTGPTGHGKSSTLAAIVNLINRTRTANIITIEDPIEYVHSPIKSVISQRELHGDTHSWQVALRSVLREDPDVVLVGEMRDYETIAAALTVAETGHLVLATLHTNSAAQTIDRIIDVFPENQQPQVRMQLSNALEAVIAQRLIPGTNGGRLPATEILLATSAVKNTIREGKTHQLDNVIQTSGELGMMSLEASLAYWVKQGEIKLEVATQFALRPEELNRLVKGRQG